jgi:negative regulator of flagellin synthesis FlgM
MIYKCYGGKVDMKINGIGANKVINLYSVNKRQEAKETKEIKKDSLEISSAARSLSSLSAPDSFEGSPERIEAVKKALSEGTYKPDGRLIANKIMDRIKGREV